MSPELYSCTRRERTTILGYEIPRNNTAFHTHICEILTEGQVEKKIAALRSYKSQSIRPYWRARNWKATMTKAGEMCGARWAEPFELIKGVNR